MTGATLYMYRACVYGRLSHSFWCRDWSLAAVMEIQSLERIQTSWRSPAYATWRFSDRVSANVLVCGRCGYCDNIRCSTLGADRRWTVLPVGSTATNNTDHPLVCTQDPRGSTTDKKGFLEGRNRLVGSLPSIVDKYECRRSSRGHLHLPRATELQRLSIFHSGARCRRHSSRPTWVLADPGNSYRRVGCRQGAHGLLYYCLHVREHTGGVRVSRPDETHGTEVHPAYLRVRRVAAEAPRTATPTTAARMRSVGERVVLLIDRAWPAVGWRG